MYTPRRFLRSAGVYHFLSDRGSFIEISTVKVIKFINRATNGKNENSMKFNEKAAF